MATTNSGFLKFAAGASTIVLARPSANVAGGSARSAAPGSIVSSPTCRWRPSPKMARYGCVVGTTVKAISLSDTTITADSYAGDTAFAFFGQPSCTTTGPRP